MVKYVSGYGWIKVNVVLHSFFGGLSILTVTSVKSDKFLNVKKWNTGKISLKYEEWRLTIVKMERNDA